MFGDFYFFPTQAFWSTLIATDRSKSFICFRSLILLLFHLSPFSFAFAISHFLFSFFSFLSHLFLLPKIRKEKRVWNKPTHRVQYIVPLGWDEIYWKFILHAGISSATSLAVIQMLDKNFVSLFFFFPFLFFSSCGWQQHLTETKLGGGSRRSGIESRSFVRR